MIIDRQTRYMGQGMGHGVGHAMNFFQSRGRMKEQGHDPNVSSQAVTLYLYRY
jgi:hypothetical protein